MARKLRHYLQLQVTAGQGFVRVYFPLASEDETTDEAVGRWLDSKVAGRQRNIAKARAAWEARIEHRRVARPSSWHRARGTAFEPGQSGVRPKRRRRRAGA